MEELADAPFADGLLMFNTACKEIELHFLEEHDQLQEAYTAAKKRMDTILVQLEEEYKHRDELWANLEATIDALAEQALKDLQETPGNVERTIARLEKERKALEFDAVDTALAEQKFKELLSLMM
ncbi:hypothetical protein BDQ17DRAFT_439220 [Cyathus striatus]|nr:hypothetical protein BDQ17DRAFT_127103 [Cyathus striatus]KAF9014059.1 hypothetical protein BDQ17DRAFT_439220 [Cyathus striatus]